MGRPTPRPQPAVQESQPAGRQTEPITRRIERIDRSERTERIERTDRRTPAATEAVRRLVTPINTRAVPEHAPPPERVPPPAPAAPPKSAPPAPARRAKRKRKRAHGWTVMIIPPEYAGSTRTYQVRRWHLRMLIGGLVSLIVLALGGGFAAGIDTSAGQLDAINTSLLESEDLVEAMGDTIRALRIAATAVAPAAEATAGKTVAAAPARPRAIAAPRRRESAAPASLVPAAGVVLPVDGRISSGFSYSRRHPILRIRRPHLGVDITASVGTSITAPAAGRVKYVGRKLAYGVVVEIDHGGGIVTRYAHCRASLVTVGQDVTAGTPIAKVGSSGLSTGPHVHYEVLVNGRQVNPLRYPLGAVIPSATAGTTAPDSGAAVTPSSTVTPSGTPTPGGNPQSTPDTAKGNSTR